MPTDTATFRGSARRSGNRSADKAQTAITELSVVSGICGRAAFGKAVTKSSHAGGDQDGNVKPKPSELATSGMRPDGEHETNAKQDQSGGKLAGKEQQQDHQAADNRPVK